MKRERLFNLLRGKKKGVGAPSPPFSRDFFQWLYDKDGENGIREFIERTMDRKKLEPNQIRRYEEGYLVVGEHLYYTGSSPYLAFIPNLFMMWGVWRSVKVEEGKTKREGLFLTVPNITSEWIKALPKHVVRPGKGSLFTLYKGRLDSFKSWETYGDKEFFSEYLQLLTSLGGVDLPKLDGIERECAVCHHRNINITRHHITPKFIISFFIHPSEGGRRGKRRRKGKKEEGFIPDHLQERFIEIPLCIYCHNHGGKGSVEYLLNVLERMYDSISTLDSFLLLLNLGKLNDFIIKKGLYVLREAKKRELVRIKNPRVPHITKYLARDPFYKYIEGFFQQEPFPW